MNPGASDEDLASIVNEMARLHSPHGDVASAAAAQQAAATAAIVAASV